MNVYQKKDNNCKDYSFSINSKFAKLLKKYNLCNKKSGFKFIPKEALLSDLEYRKKLLAGLIDSDGYLSKSCSYSISTKSKQMAEDILNLIYSLGGRGEIYNCKKSIKKLNFIGEYYKVSFFILGLNLPLKTKRRMKKENSCYLSSNRIAIKVIPNPKKCYVYGFTLDSPSHQYITNNWMVTLNSGKSYCDLRKAELVHLSRFNKNEFPPENICFSIAELLERITSGKLRKGEVLILEEAGVNAGSGDWQNRVVKLFNYVLQSFRSMNVCLFMNLPVLGMLAKQARQLIHIHMETSKIDHKKNELYVKPLFHQLNQQTGKSYWKYIKVKAGDKIVKVKRMTFNKPSQELIDIYEQKKLAFLSGITNDFKEEIIVSENKKLNRLKRKELTAKQQAVYDLVLAGLRTEDIAKKLGCSKSGVTNNRIAIKRKGYSLISLAN
jgi:hypothetical protein